MKIWTVTTQAWSEIETNCFTFKQQFWNSLYPTGAHFSSWEDARNYVIGMPKCFEEDYENVYDEKISLPPLEKWTIRKDENYTEWYLFPSEQEEVDLDTDENWAIRITEGKVKGV